MRHHSVQSPGFVHDLTNLALVALKSSPMHRLGARLYPQVLKSTALALHDVSTVARKHAVVLYTRARSEVLPALQRCANEVVSRAQQAAARAVGLFQAHAPLWARNADPLALWAGGASLVLLLVWSTRVRPQVGASATDSSAPAPPEHPPPPSPLNETAINETAINNDLATQVPADEALLSDRKKSIKVVTHRKESPTGAHVVSFVSLNTDEVKQLEPSKRTVTPPVAAAAARPVKFTYTDLAAGRVSPALLADEKGAQSPASGDDEGAASAAALVELDGPAALLQLKRACMKARVKLNWDDELPLEAWDRCGFDGDGDGAQLVRLDLAVQAVMPNRFDCELRCDIGVQLAPLLGPRLVSLQLEGNNGVSGNIKVLAGCPLLEEALISVTALVGDISVFTGCPGLKHVSLGGGRGRLPITGDIACFKSCPLLVSVKVFKAAVTGDVGCFGGCPDLEHVSINKSTVSGNVAVFSACPKLQNVTLSLTRVTGSIRAFEHCPKLERLSLRGAGGVTGQRNHKAPLDHCPAMVPAHARRTYALPFPQANQTT